MGDGPQEIAATLAGFASALQQERNRPAVPALWFVTDDRRTPEPLKIARALPAGAAVLFRHYGHPQRAELASEISQICRDRALKLFVAADLALARAVHAHGIHLPSWAASPGLPSKGLIISAAVHGVTDLARIADIADIVVASPVFNTQSHPDKPSLGAKGLAAIVASTTKPVIALGGITIQNAEELLGTGAAGIAAIGAFLSD